MKHLNNSELNLIARLLKEKFISMPIFRNFRERNLVGNLRNKIDEELKDREMKQDLFNYMSKNHGVSLLQTEMDEVIDICRNHLNE